MRDVRAVVTGRDPWGTTSSCGMRRPWLGSAWSPRPWARPWPYPRRRQPRPRLVTGLFRAFGRCGQAACPRSSSVLWVRGQQPMRGEVDCRRNRSGDGSKKPTGRWPRRAAEGHPAVAAAGEPCVGEGHRAVGERRVAEVHRAAGDRRVVEGHPVAGERCVAEVHDAAVERRAVEAHECCRRTSRRGSPWCRRW